MQQGHAFQTPINIGALELPNSSSVFDFTGQVKVIVEKAELRAAKNNQANVMLALTLKVIEGEHTGSRAVTNLNLYNSNQDAVKIAYAELAAYATAMGADPMLTNTAQLCGKPFCIFVSVTEVDNPNDPNKKYKNNKFSDWAYADGTPIVRGQFGSAGGAAQAAGGNYAAPNQVAAPVAPVAAPQQVQQVQQPAQQQYAPQATAPQATAPAQQAAPQGYAAPVVAPVVQQQQAPAAGGFAPPAGAAPFVPQG